MTNIKIVNDYTGAKTYNSSGKDEHYEFEFQYSLIREFQKLFYYSHAQTLLPTKWLGVPMIKYPTDLIVYQEMIWALKPEVIVETGTAYGGSALYFATICDAAGAGQVITVDKASPKPETRKQHPRITYLLGDSISPEILAQIMVTCQDKRVLVVLDSLHTKDHVLAEMELYGRLVNPGSYMVVEDGNINGHPVRPDFGPGPFEAIEEYLANHPEFERDRVCERFLLTCAPGGFLKRK